MDLLLLRSILDDAGIPFFVHNDTFGSLYTGRYAEAYNRKTLYISEVDLSEAQVLLREFFERTGQSAPSQDQQSPPRLFSLVQTILERAARRWPAHSGGPTARRLWKQLSRWGWVAEPPDPRRQHLRLIRNDQPRPSEGGDENRRSLRLL